MEPPFRGRVRRFYILDVVTRERINLPGVVIESDRLIYFLPVRSLRSPILWIDEKTKDYLVIGLVDDEALVCFKKGDDSWKQIPQLSFSCIYTCFHMVYKDHKLYCLNYDDLHIFDFSGDIPLQVSRISVHGYVKREKWFGIISCRNWGMNVVRRKNNVVVTVGGDVLIVRSKRRPRRTWRFRIYKMDSSNGNNWEEIASLGDEAIVLDLGVTVLAKDLEGITRNSIYFNDQHGDLFIFNLNTKKMEQPQKLVSSSHLFSNARYCRWFLPSFKRE